MKQYRTTNLAQAPLLDAESLARTRKLYRASPWQRLVIRPLLMAIMILALLTGFVFVIQAVVLDSSWTQLLPLFFFVAIEAIYTTIWLKHPDRLSLDRSAYRAAELFLILLLVRLVTWIVFAEGIPTRSELMDYFRAPHTLFINGTFIVTLVLTLIAWRLAIMLSAIFSDLEISEFELRFYSLPARIRKERADDQPIQIGRRKLVAYFTQFWLWGGILLAFSVGISSIDLTTIENYLTALGITRLGLPPLLMTMLMLYFGIGFWLLSQAYFMEQNAHWLINDVHKDHILESRWQRFSLIILLFIATIAAFLPIGSTVPISRIINIIIYWGLLLVNLLIFLILWPIGALLAFFGRGADVEQPAFQPPAAMPQPELPPGELSPMNETITLVLSSAFWAIFIVALIVALVFFLRERKIKAEGGSSRRLGSIVKEWLRNAWLRLVLGIKSLEIKVPRIKIRREQEEPADEKQSSRWRYIRLGSLSPREQIRYFYLSTIRRAGEKGVHRAPSETPLEFAEDLNRTWPEVEDGVDELTEAFLRARYSDQEFQTDDVPSVKATWKSVRKEIRNQAKPDDGEHDDFPKSDEQREDE